MAKPKRFHSELNRLKSDLTEKIISPPGPRRRYLSQPLLPSSTSSLSSSTSSVSTTMTRSPQQSSPALPTVNPLSTDDKLKLIPRVKLIDLTKTNELSFSLKDKLCRKTFERTNKILNNYVRASKPSLTSPEPSDDEYSTRSLNYSRKKVTFASNRSKKSKKREKRSISTDANFWKNKSANNWKFDEFDDSDVNKKRRAELSTASQGSKFEKSARSAEIGNGNRDFDDSEVISGESTILKKLEKVRSQPKDNNSSGVSSIMALELEEEPTDSFKTSVSPESDKNSLASLKNYRIPKKKKNNDLEDEIGKENLDIGNNLKTVEEKSVFETEVEIGKKKPEEKIGNEKSVVTENIEATVENNENGTENVEIGNEYMEIGTENTEIGNEASRERSNVSAVHRIIAIKSCRRLSEENSDNQSVSSGPSGRYSLRKNIPINYSDGCYDEIVEDVTHNKFFKKNSSRESVPARRSRSLSTRKLSAEVDKTDTLPAVVDKTKSLLARDDKTVEADKTETLSTGNVSVPAADNAEVVLTEVKSLMEVDKAVSDVGREVIEAEKAGEEMSVIPIEITIGSSTRKKSKIFPRPIIPPRSVIIDDTEDKKRYLYTFNTRPGRDLDANETQKRKNTQNRRKRGVDSRSPSPNSRPIAPPKKRGRPCKSADNKEVKVKVKGQRSRKKKAPVVVEEICEESDCQRGQCRCIQDSAGQKLPSMPPFDNTVEDPGEDSVLSQEIVNRICNLNDQGIFIFFYLPFYVKKSISNCR